MNPIKHQRLLSAIAWGVFSIVHYVAAGRVGLVSAELHELVAGVASLAAGLFLISAGKVD